MKQYLDLLNNVLTNGVKKSNRTGIDAISITGHMFEHNMNDGFPLVTTKKMGLKNIATELEFFIKGLTDKKWLQDRNCHIWDSWCRKFYLQTGIDVYYNQFGVYPTKETQLMWQAEECDLGPIYGYQWNNFNGSGYNQLQAAVDTLKTNPLSRRIIVSAWNPLQIDDMALPPCHYGFQLLSDGECVDLLWNQRSCDVFLGIPYNIASYALLLLLIAKETNLIPRKLIGFLADVHIYENHIEQVKTQLSRSVYKLPTVDILNFKSIYDWEYTDFNLNDYISHDKLVGVVAI